MRWDGRWTFLLFSGAALLYWVNQLNTRPPSTLLQPSGDTDIDDMAKVTAYIQQSSGGRFQTFEGVQMVLEMPTNPTAVLLLFHGCQHSSTDWWPKSDGCPACTGLSEEVRIQEAALVEGFAVVALSSQARTGNQCWDTGWPPEESADIPKVIWAVQALTKQEGWAELPLYALGASSGGALALLLALRMPLQGVCCQIMSVPASILQNQPTDESGKTWKFPPTAAIHMAKDKRTSKGVREMFAELTKQRVSVFEMLVQPQPLTPGFLANRTKDISHAVSAAIHSTLQKAGMLDSEGFLLQDPRQTSEQWQSLLHQHVAATKQMNLKHDESSIHEELNLAWAGHELVSDNISSVFEFFQANS